MLDAEALLDDVCGSNPHRAAVALAQAAGRGEELAPGILRRIQAAVQTPTEWAGEGKPFVGFLLYLAAEFRLTAAHLLITRLLRVDHDLCYRMLSDVVTEDGPAILADTFAGDTEPLLALIHDTAAGVFERGAGLEALAALVERDRLPRAWILDLLVELAGKEKGGNADDGELMFGEQIVDVALQLRAHELRAVIRGLYERGAADGAYGEAEYADRLLQPGSTELALPRSRLTIDSAWAAVRTWAFFTGDDSGEDSFDEDDPFSDAEPIDLDPDASHLPIAAPFSDPEHTPFRAPPKVGRNDPCPCGSGKKFKKCCGG